MGEPTAGSDSHDIGLGDCTCTGYVFHWLATPAVFRNAFLVSQGLFSIKVASRELCPDGGLTV